MSDSLGETQRKKRETAKRRLLAEVERLNSEAYEEAAVLPEEFTIAVPTPAQKLWAAKMLEQYIADNPDEPDWDHEEPEEKNKDLSGKYMAGVLEDFMPALKEIAKLGSMNNKPFGKYDRGSWLLVKDGETYYKDAFWRHLIEGRHTIDPTTGLPNDIAIAWNILALICFRLIREAKEKADNDTSGS